MKKNTLKIWIGCGIFCVLSVVLSSWYAVTYNDSRLVVPMDAGSYTFQIKDLPMILSVSLFCIYIFALVIGIMVCAGKRQKNQHRRKHAEDEHHAQHQPKTQLSRPVWLSGLCRFSDISH